LREEAKKGKRTLGMKTRRDMSKEKEENYRELMRMTKMKEKEEKVVKIIS